MFFEWIASNPIPALVIGLVTLIVIVGAAAWVVGTILIMPSHRVIGSPPQDIPATEIALDSESGATIRGWWCENADAQATILLFHGVRGDRRSMLARAKLFHDAGFSALLIDFQAHGESRGQKITFGYLERHDVSAALDFAREKNPDHKLGVVGSSLGGAATLLGVPREIDALVLEAVYPTIEEAVEDRARMRLGPLGFILTKLLLLQLKPRLGLSADQLRPIDHIHKIDCPIVVTAGDLDLHTRIDETRRMFEAATEPKKLVIFEGAAHIDLLDHDRELYEREILGFFRQCLLKNESSVSAQSSG
jgi:fermentation-respiration switch protein FrsA (DUF1100 family)